MYAEPIDIRLPRQAAAQPRTARAPGIIDEAFAAVTDADMRLDESQYKGPLTKGPQFRGAQLKASQPEGPKHDGARPGETAAVTGDLAETLRKQLAMIESQRRHLQRLLSGLGE